ncbi:hypothetical protein BH11ARM2_BH11ARM2_02220 [soil metagenome]
MGKDGSYSELEHLILALVEDGATSGYGIKKRITRTQNGRWNAESGAVYRVLRRLQEAELIEESARLGPHNRERREYRLTEKGRATIDEWFRYAPEPKEMSYLIDPLRTRCYFLGRHTSDERRRIVETWISESLRLCESLEKEIQKPLFNDRIKDAAYGNLLYMARARHDWLENLRAIVAEEA